MGQEKSNRQKGRENLATLRRWLDEAEKIPDRGGKANISAIATAAGLDRQVLYRDDARAMIKEAVAEKGLGMPDQEAPQGRDLPAWAARRIHNLEQELTSARVELAELRAKVRGLQHIDRHVAETGRMPR